MPIDTNGWGYGPQLAPSPEHLLAVDERVTTLEAVPPPTSGIYTLADSYDAAVSGSVLEVSLSIPVDYEDILVEIISPVTDGAATQELTAQFWHSINTTPRAGRLDGGSFTRTGGTLAVYEQFADGSKMVVGKDAVIDNTPVFTQTSLTHIRLKKIVYDGKPRLVLQSSCVAGPYGETFGHCTMVNNWDSELFDTVKLTITNGSIPTAESFTSGTFNLYTISY